MRFALPLLSIAAGVLAGDTATDGLSAGWVIGSMPLVGFGVLALSGTLSGWHKKRSQRPTGDSPMVERLKLESPAEDDWSMRRLVGTLIGLVAVAAGIFTGYAIYKLMLTTGGECGYVAAGPCPEESDIWFGLFFGCLWGWLIGLVVSAALASPKQNPAGDEPQPAESSSQRQGKS